MFPARRAPIRQPCRTVPGALQVALAVPAARVVPAVPVAREVAVARVVPVADVTIFAVVVVLAVPAVPAVPVDPEGAVGSAPVGVETPLVLSVSPAVGRPVVESPSAPSVKSSTTWKPRRLAACGCPGVLVRRCGSRAVRR